MVYSCDEYSEYIYETYNEYVNDEKVSRKEAVARTFNEYDMLMKKSESDKLIISVIIAEILASHSKASNTFKTYMVETISNINNMLIKQEHELTQEQYNDFFSRKKQVLIQLEAMPSDYYPRVCWCYEELTDEVNTYFGEINFKDRDEKEVVDEVVKRFERDCKNTISEKIVVYTTLAENLLRHNLTQQIKGTSFIDELKGFTLDSIQDEQLSDVEKEKLAQRIQVVLNSVT
ncbi:Imm3 family immunity protein [Paenibacillus sinopodophylli]|uniref:Imm3 family immunity protein n=1 Tax=Paenibacillus sinopodophylli TaxID=1837342 RepID=UPI00110CC969|nr:Imm3 family immunity protein [Paenibacillus sinopodophylli]